jgi:nucleoporin NUP82
MRLTASSLTLQTDSARSRPVKTLVQSDDASKVALITADDPRAYVSLLGSEPFLFATFSRPSGLPLDPRVALPNIKTDKPDFMLTPDTLRYFAKTAEGFNSQIHAIQLAYRTATLRIGLQKQEFHRQQDTCGEMIRLIEKLEHHDITQQKITKIRETQKALLSRLDRRLQSLMDNASPELSESETKWFEELKRLKVEISGTGRYDQDSLTTRTALVRDYFSDRTWAHC